MNPCFTRLSGRCSVHTHTLPEWEGQGCVTVHHYVTSRFLFSSLIVDRKVSYILVQMRLVHACKCYCKLQMRHVRAYKCYGKLQIVQIWEKEAQVHALNQVSWAEVLHAMQLLVLAKVLGESGKSVAASSCTCNAIARLGESVSGPYVGGISHCEASPSLGERSMR